MKRRFLALRVISTIYKILGVLSLIGMIGAIALVLLDATGYPTMESKLQPIGIALGSGIGSALVLFAVAQFLDLMMAIEINTRASNAMLQQLGKVMKERL
jgi:hypothetical protein